MAEAQVPFWHFWFRRGFALPAWRASMATVGRLLPHWRGFDDGSEPRPACAGEGRDAIVMPDRAIAG
jgi:hypothetical protein